MDLYVIRLATIAIILAPAAAVAQDRNLVREQARTSAAQLRAWGEPKDRCATGAELQDSNVITRVYPGSAFQKGDRLLTLNGVDVAGKTTADAIAVLRTAAADATIPATVSRSGSTRQIQINCINSRPVMETYALGLDQAAAGKFDECFATFSRPVNLGFGGAAMKAQCAALARKPDDRIVGEANFDAMRLAVEDATYNPAVRGNVARQLRAAEGTIIRSVGAERFQQLVAITRMWPGDEGMFAKSEPDWALFRRNGEQSLRTRLIDPDSARIEWTRGFTYGTWKPMLGKRIEGYWTCGLINARNRMGGYTGSTAFVVVMDQSGNSLFADMGSGRDYDILTSQCANSAKMLPSAPAALAGTAEAAPTSASSLGDELKKLADLKASGALSDAEFQAAKQRLLGVPKP